MKVLKKSGNYLKRKATQNLILTLMCFLIFSVVFATAIDFLPLYIDVGKYETFRVLFLLFPLILALYFYRNYSGWKQGYKGEEAVTKALTSNLSDEYFLFNSIYLNDGYGDIDHLVLGPNGIFAVETKNYVGKISVCGDKWSRQYKTKKRGSFGRKIQFDLGSPSRQVKNNAFRIKKIVDSISSLRSRNLGVQGVVVFPNWDLELRISKPTVPILRLYELPNFIRNTETAKILSAKELKLLGNEILLQTS